eukprot:TRINITY_DN3409_c0_g1_i2.p1 TRINITY_DN3409_c0_g1~~TRINITY_DN3409_c0_g1_i2.p1  ORF type:complete len:277 (-),score=28.90 TRINITY_DN3409_c0_g1_i2:49-858(-)
METVPSSVFELFDAHAHIYGEEFQSDVAQVLDDATKAGVRTIINVSENINTARQIFDLSKQFPILKVGIGLHPIPDDKSANREQVDEILQFARSIRDDVVCIGECGLDFSPFAVKTSEQKEDQRYVLERQIELARELDLPLNVHSRSAGKPTIDLLKEKNAKNVLLHCFDGNAKAVKLGLECGFYFSIPASIVRQESTRKLAQLVPLDRLLLETDSPALHPIKASPVKNVPANLRLSCEEVAKVKGLSYEQVAAATMQNAKKLFPKAFR